MTPSAWKCGRCGAEVKAKFAESADDAARRHEPGCGQFIHASAVVSTLGIMIGRETGTHSKETYTEGSLASGLRVHLIELVRAVVREETGAGS